MEREEGGGGSSNLKSQLEESRQHTEAQRLRCLSLAQRLRAIQLEELQDLAEEQAEAALATISNAKGIEMEEREYGKPPPETEDLYEDEEPGADRLSGPHLHDPALWKSKKGKDAVRDVTGMIRKNMKELMFATKPFGAYDEDKTDSDSDYEDEFEARASVRGQRNFEEFQGYLPVEENPLTKWARQRMEILTRWKWLKVTSLLLQFRLKENDKIVGLLKHQKPSLQLDPDPEPVETPSSVATEALKDATVQFFHEGTPSPKEKGSPRKTWRQKRVTTISYPKLPKTNSSPKETVGNIGETGKGDVGGGLEPLKLKIIDTSDTTSSRCLPLKPFKARKIFQLGGIHNIFGEPKRHITTLCDCFGRTELCVICTGRTNKMKPLKYITMASKETTALLDHTYHKALAESEDKPLRRLIEASLKTEDWKKPATIKHEITCRNESDDDDDEEEEEEGVEIIKPLFLPTFCTREVDVISLPPSPEKKPPPTPRARKEKKPAVKQKRTPKKSARSRKLSDDDEDEEADWAPPTKRARTDNKRKKTDEKYDIDHIVIPYSIAAATRVEKIEYKEISLPSWRIVELPEGPSPPSPLKPGQRMTRRRWSGNSKHIIPFVDMSEAAIAARHLRSEIEEKRRFMRYMNKLNKRGRKSESAKQDNPEDPQSVSPLPEVPETTTSATDEGAPPGQQISLADASLAVTALKIAKPTSSRRRTASGKKMPVVEEEEPQEPGVAPWEERKFPLSDDVYAEMVREMEECYKESDLPASTLEDAPMKTQNDMFDHESDAEEADPDWAAEETPAVEPTPSTSKAGRRKKKAVTKEASK